MTRDIQLSRGNSPYIGQLTKGCRECMKGAKLVFFVSGKCSKDCYYCPISEERKDQDEAYANEVEITDPEQAITEAQLINATGMGITGGEPLQNLTRTLNYIRRFKRVFGKKFHIHLYTGLEPVPLDAVTQLLDAGLDELRLHRFEVGADFLALRNLMKGKGRLGLEIPVIPGMLESLKDLFRKFDEIGIDFINLNEMEFTALNAQQLRERGYELDSDTIASVKESEDVALALLEWASTETSLNIHYCPLSLKDGHQLRSRFKRRAKNIRKPFEKISNEGLLVKGVIYPSKDVSLRDLYKYLLSEEQVPSEQLWVNETKGQIETSVQIARRLARRIKSRGASVGIVEEYPIDSRFQVSYYPL
ncbi:MAG: radical SAM protein [Promethearchaeota archaeon]